MKVAAPGKLFTTGAFAVLRGAPAVVLAVDRFVYASHGGTPSTRPEVLAVARRRGAVAPAVDVGGLEIDGRKLGLGGSAAAAVAAAGLLLSEKGPIDAAEVLEVAFAAHREVQPRGSGADVAAAAFGGVVVVHRHGDRLDARPAQLPPGLVWRAYALPRSARTSDALDRLAERATHPAVRRALLRLVGAAHGGAEAVDSRDLPQFLAAAAEHVAGLGSLGEALDLPLVPPEIARACDVLHDSGIDSVLLPSGAGGGDIALFLSSRPPTGHEEATLEALGLQPLSLGVAPRGVHLVEQGAH
ncbi:MAG: hypothetical protein IPJ34_39420 [Myxococcales bacterium]|nr:hypothetical protein [Myxococcales bacterium]